MLSGVAPPPPPLSSAMTMDQLEPSDARKRRRELLALQRTVSTSPCTFVTCKTIAPPAAQRLSSSSKKPQMKYDPEVPMTKEEAAIWRREQRRQRNRLSAAQSRERQRHRIAELENELDEWKDKYAAVQNAIETLLAQQASPVTDDEARATSPIPSTIVSKSISPSASPTSCLSMVLEPCPDEKFNMIWSLSYDDPESTACNISTLKPLKMISRPAMSSITINS